MDRDNRAGSLQKFTRWLPPCVGLDLGCPHTVENDGRGWKKQRICPKFPKNLATLRGLLILRPQQSPHRRQNVPAFTSPRTDGRIESTASPPQTPEQDRSLAERVACFRRPTSGPGPADRRPAAGRKAHRAAAARRRAAGRSIRRPRRKTRCGSAGSRFRCRFLGQEKILSRRAALGPDF
jgi:hypothetical protein